MRHDHRSASPVSFLAKVAHLPQKGMPVAIEVVGLDKPCGRILDGLRGSHQRDDLGEVERIVLVPVGFDKRGGAASKFGA